jgi:hypothetical protein
MQVDPRKYAVIRSWFRRVSENTLIHHFALTSPWQTQELYFEGECLVLPHPNGRIVLRRMAASEYSERLEGWQTAAHRQMDLDESAYDRCNCRGI